MINFMKKGNGAAWIGLSFIVLIFLLGLLMIDYFNRFDALIQTQTKTDAIADAMAVAANDGTGMPNLPEIARTKDEIVNKMNDDAFTQITSVDYDREMLFGLTGGGEKLLQLEVKTTTPYLNANYFRLSPTDTGIDNIIFTGRNTTKILIDANSMRNQRFPEDILIACDPALTHSSSDGFPMSPDEYRNIVIQFTADRTDRYVPDGNHTRQNVYIWDVTRALGCELPYYYRTMDGKPWEILGDGHLDENGYTNYIMKTVDDDNIRGLLNMLKAHIFDLKIYYNMGNAVCPSPYSDYSKWSLVGSGNDISTLNTIQDNANNGYPTIVLFENGSSWIVLPELEETDGSRGLFVSYVTSVPESALEHFATNIEANSTTAGYRQPSANFVALTYGI